MGLQERFQDFNNMQIIYKNKDERDDSRRVNSVGTIIYIERISKHLKGEYFGESRDRNFRI